jgi:hypothetical protein
MRSAVVGGRRVVVVARQRCLCGNCGTDSGHANAEHGGEPRYHSR